MEKIKLALSGFSFPPCLDIIIVGVCKKSGQRQLEFELIYADPKARDCHVTLPI